MHLFQRKSLPINLIAACLLMSQSVSSGEADVLKVKAFCDDKSLCNFSVQVEHADQGWQHYANRWEVLSVDGEILATRELAHPHEQEQPFTRSLTKVPISKEIKEVVVRAHDSVHGYGGKEVTVTLRE